MKIDGRHEQEIELTDEEADVLAMVKAIFASKSGVVDGSEFRVAFVKNAMQGYCDACGRGGIYHCYCTRDD